LLANGQNEQGVAELSETLRWLEAESEPSPGSWRFLSALVDGLLALGRHAEAGEVARDWHRRTRRFGTPSTYGMSQRAVALCRQGEAQIDGLRVAEKTLAPCAAKAEHARTLLELGASLRRAGQRREARKPLRVALDLAARCGATPLAERARVELVACGARPRRALLSGIAALTPSERRVAQMASDGLTNREIANGLFVSPKTVERHLTNIYVKLEINDRSRLPELMAPDQS
jgi:DNA-binding CsgD family transcriptional regulator